MCVNFILEWRDLQFKVNSDWQILKNFSMQFYLFPELLPKICWDEVADEIFSNFFLCLTWASNYGLTSNKSYLRDYGDFIHIYWIDLYNVLVRIRLWFHTTYVVRVKSCDLQFKVNCEWQIFEKLFMAILFTLRVFAEICWEELVEEIISYFRFDVRHYV